MRRCCEEEKFGNVVV
jgi:hypothetical protein